MSIYKKEITIKTNRTINRVYINGKESSIPTIFLHGFTGSNQSWEEVITILDGKSIALDLPGHGKSIFKDLDIDYNIEDWCEDFIEIVTFLKLDIFNLCGYSMGGRLAIAFASKYPEKINKLILESTSFGIEDKNDRKIRFEEDLNLCSLIETDFHEFIQKWENNPLFLKQRDRNSNSFFKQQADRLLRNPAQLSKALKSFSQGKMNFYNDEIPKFSFPIMIINGFEDDKYIEIGKILNKINDKSIHYIIDNSNHNVHLESIDAFIDLLRNG